MLDLFHYHNIIEIKYFFSIPKWEYRMTVGNSISISSSHHPITKIGRVIGYDSGCSSILDDVEHDRAVPMIEQIDQIMDALLDHDLIEEPL